MEKKMETTIVNSGVSQIMGTILGGPNNNDYNILRSILGSPDFGELRCGVCLIMCLQAAVAVEGHDCRKLSGMRLKASLALHVAGQILLR